MSIFSILLQPYRSLPRITGALALTGLLLLTFSCQRKQEDMEQPEEPVVARVHDQFLYLTELSEIIPKNASKEDSMLLARNYILSWIKKQLILKKAEDNLADEKKDVEQRLNEYRNSLITYIYESELVEQRMDTTVSDEEIEAYYNENKENFPLKDNIVKVLYLKVNKKAPKLNKVRVWYKSNNPKDRKLLEDYCFQFASDFHLDDESWLHFDDILKRVPVKTYDKESFLRSNRYVETEGSSFYYFVQFKDMQIRESISPLGFVRDDIRNLILNKRKLDLIREMEQSVYDEASKNNEFEVFLQ